MKRFVYLLLSIATAFLFLYAASHLRSTFNLYPTIPAESARQDIEQGRVIRIVVSEESSVVRLYYPASGDGEEIKIVADRASLSGLQPEKLPAIEVEQKPPWLPCIEISILVLAGLGFAAVASRVLWRR